MARSGNEELKAFIRQLGTMPKDVRQDLRPKLKAVGQNALFSVRAKAATWSTRIPRATRLSIGLSKKKPGLAIFVSKNKAPHGRPFENQGKQGTFRAPLFGDRKRWYAHTARPFFQSGAQPWLDKADKDLKQVVDEAARKAGFR